MAYERVTLYGVPLVAGAPGRLRAGSTRSCPASCSSGTRWSRATGRPTTSSSTHNRALLDEVEELEDRARRRDIVVDDETLFDFYDERIPADVVSGRHFDALVEEGPPHRTRTCSTSPRTCWSTSGRRGATTQRLPRRLASRAGCGCALTYQFEPGAAADGVTVHVPLPVLNQVRPDGFDWQVPGLREELVTALIRSLPKAMRRHFVPAPDHARSLLPAAAPRARSRCWRRWRASCEARGRCRRCRATPGTSTGCPTTCGSPSGWSTSGRTLAEGKDLERPQARAAPADAGRDLPGRPRPWSGPACAGGTWTALPRDVRAPRRPRWRPCGAGYPALVDEGDSVAVRVLDTEAEQRQAMWAGTRRLLLLDLPSPLRPVVDRLSNADQAGAGPQPARQRRRPAGGLPAVRAPTR